MTAFDSTLGAKKKQTVVRGERGEMVASHFKGCRIGFLERCSVMCVGYGMIANLCSPNCILTLSRATEQYTILRHRCYTKATVLSKLSTFL